MAKKHNNARQPAQRGISALHAVHPMIAKAVVEKNAQDVVDSQVPVWDELNELLLTCQQGLVSPVILGQLAQRKDLIVFIRDKAGLVTRINMFKQDILQLKKELDDIAAQHAGKTGGSDDLDDIMRANQISEQYQLFLTRMDAVITPTVGHILEIFTEAELIQQQAKVEAGQAAPAYTPEQDPNVVTDVVSTLVNTQAELG